MSAFEVELGTRATRRANGGLRIGVRHHSLVRVQSGRTLRTRNLYSNKLCAQLSPSKCRVRVFWPERPENDFSDEHLVTLQQWPRHSQLSSSPSIPISLSSSTITTDLNPPPMASSLDQIVKGAVPPSLSVDAVVASAAQSLQPRTDTPRSSPDPTSLLPSSPPQIYLNLLILEASLRTQYLTLRARRRQNTFVLVVLALWVAYFFHGQFLRARLDGSGIVGGSPYWLVDVFEKVALISGLVMGVLFWVTGQWERGVRWPRRWLGVSNRGLRAVNLKVVVVKDVWWKEWIGHLSFLFPLTSWLVQSPGSSYAYVEYNASEKREMQRHGRLRSSGKAGDWAEEDVAKGGDYVKIMLLPKHFTPDFREGWEIYRTEYWEQENQRRSGLRKRIRAKEREIARRERGWFWWTGWRGWAKSKGIGAPKSQHEKDRETMPPPQHPHSHVHSATHQVSQKEKEKHRRRSSAVRDQEREGSHSRSSSRSSVAALEHEERERRWSTSTTGSTGSRRRKIVSEDPRRAGNITSRPTKLTPANGSSRPSTSSSAAQLRSQNSNVSAISSGTDSSDSRPSTAKTTPEPTVKVESIE